MPMKRYEPEQNIAYGESMLNQEIDE